MKAIDFHPDAADEARAAAVYYDRKRAGLGEEFREELRAALARIQEDPQFFPVERGAIRLCPLKRFSYAVLFEELSDRIWIAAIAHHRRRPGYWARRDPE